MKKQVQNKLDISEWRPHVNYSTENCENQIESLNGKSFDILQNVTQDMSEHEVTNSSYLEKDQVTQISLMSPN